MANNQLTLTIKANTAMLQAALKQAQASVDGFAKRMKSGAMANAGDFKNAFDTAGKAIEGIFKRVAATAIGGSFGVAALIKSAAGLQASAQSMKVLAGNTEVANKLFSQLATYANTTPFDFPEIAKAGKTLLGFGIESNKVFGHVQMLGDIAAATGADFGSLALVFGQVNATGRLMGQDSLQLINNNIPITTILAKKLGISVQQVKDQMEKGRIGVDLFNEALLETTQKGGFAFKGTEELAKTLNGRMSTLKDTVMEVGRNLIGVKIDPNNGGLIIEQNGLFDKFSQTVEKATKWLDENKETIQKIANVVLDNFVPAISALATVFVLAKIAGLAFNIVMYANPIMLIVGAVLALIGVLVFLQVKFNIFGEAWDFIKGVWSGATAFFGGIWNGIVAIFSVVGRWFIEIFSSAWNGVKSIFSGVGGFFRGVWSSITSVFSRIGVSIADAVSGAVRGAVNSVLGFAEGTINGFIRAINSAIGVINEIPGVKIPVIGQLRIPRMASGGIVTPAGGGSIIHAGDGGQNEWIVPESKMASLVKQINSRSESVGSNEVNITVNVTTQGERFSDSDAVDMAQKINNALRSQGLTLSQLGALR